MAAPEVLDGRLLLDAGVRVRMRVLVTLSEPDLLSRGGALFVRHLFEDLGFDNVLAFSSAFPPVGWEPRAAGAAIFPDSLAWVEGTPASAINFAEKVSGECEVTDVWRADDATQRVPFRAAVPPPPPAPPSSSSSSSSSGEIAGWLALVAVAGVAIALLTRRR